MTEQMINKVFDYFNALEIDGLIYKKPRTKYTTYRDMNGYEIKGKKTLERIYSDMADIDMLLFAELAKFNRDVISRQIKILFRYILDDIVVHRLKRKAFCKSLRKHIRVLSDQPELTEDEDEDNEYDPDYDDDQE